MSWWSTIPALLAASAMVILPGTGLALAMGFSFSRAVGLAPLFSVSIASVAAILASAAHIRWSVLCVLAVTVLAAGLALLLPRVMRTRNLEARGKTNWSAVCGAAGGVLIAAVLIARRLMQLIGQPENFEQGFDNVFHLNAVRYIVDTGDASSLTLGHMAGSQGLAAVYPAAWHSLAALVVQLTGTPVLTSVNALNIVIGALVWPLSMVFLIRVVLGRTSVGLLAAGIMSAGLAAFPFLLMVWGPLFPNALAVSILPAGIGLLILICRMGREIELPRWLAWPAAVVAVPGLACSHPSSFSILLVVALPILLWRLAIRVSMLRRTKAQPHRFALTGAVALAGGLLGLVFWLKVRPAFDMWKPHTTVAGGIGEALTVAPLGGEIAWTVTVLSVIGLVDIARRRVQLWVVLCYGLVAALYVVDAGVPQGALRSFLTGPWYQDTYRLASLLPIFATVLASAGLVCAVEWFRRRLRRLSGRQMFFRGRPGALTLQAGGLVGLAVVLAGLTQGPAIKDYVRQSQRYYAVTDNSSILTSDEYSLLRRLDRFVPPDAVIADNPWNGSSLAYAVSGRRVLTYPLYNQKDDEDKLISQHLRDAEGSPGICRAVQDKHVGYVLDFGQQYVANDADSKSYSGLEGLETSPAVRLIDQQGAAKLYEVTACQ